MPDEGFAPDCNFPLVYGEKGRIAIDLKAKDDNCCEVQTDILYSLKGGKIYNAVIDYCEATTRKDLSVEFNEYLNKNFNLNMLTPATGKEKVYKSYMK